MVRSIPAVADWIYRTTPGLRAFMDRDDIRQECELATLRGRGETVHRLRCHIVDVARRLGGDRRYHKYVTIPLTFSPPVLPTAERSVLLEELVSGLTSRQRQVIEHHLRGDTSQETGAALGIKPGSAEAYKCAAIRQMRVVVRGAA